MITNIRVSHAVVRSILLYKCETWTVRVADEMILVVFDDDSILHVRRRDYVPTEELGRRLSLTCLPGQLDQRRLRWFGHAVDVTN